MDKIIGIDTMVFIYHIEEHPVYSQITEGIFDAVEKGRRTAVTSVITLLEILVKPKIENNHGAVKDYRDTLLTFPNLKIFDVDLRVSEKASDLRAKYSIRTPDAIQIATAILAGAGTFLTNDESLKRVKDIKVYLLEDMLRQQKGS
ncbi:motility twitching protein PilT [Dissulfurispira thermophila]|uniref:Motility twitching protein PilT n=2 Tax=root TaxID=1 RepID=A0A7G1GYS9_9BACT|nr:type II toxin-antitoxin system VapC family toxin [Dissulfurispira thermophila]BCB95222.1 motility twitching protein PilT [Dissulfurispira thermophila]